MKGIRPLVATGWGVIGRYLLIGLAVLVALIVAGVTAGYIWLQSDSGRDWLIATITGATASPDMQITLSEIEGRIPTDFTLGRVEIADSQGTWLTLDRLHVGFSPLALLGGQARIEQLEAARVAVARAPVTTQPPAPEEPSTSLLPQLPVTVALDRLVVQELVLEEPLLGEAATMRIEGAGRLDAGGDGLATRLAVDRIDQQPGQARLDLAFAPDEDRLDLNLKASEPAGGVIARTLSIPGLPPVSLSLDGEGTLSNWNGKLIATAENTAQMTADATIQAIAEGHAITLTAGGDLAALLGEPAAQLVGSQPALSATVVVAGDGALTLRPVALRAAAGEARLNGTVGAGYQNIDLRYEVTAGSDSALRQLAPGIRWEQGRIAGTARGTLSDLAVVLEGSLRELAGDIPGLAELAGPEVRLDGRARVDAAQGNLDLEGLTLATAAATASVQGNASGWGQSAELAARLVAEDLSRLSALAGRPLAGSALLEAPVTLAPDGALATTLSGALRNLRTGTPTDAVLGEEARLGAKLAMEPNGTMRVGDLAVDGANGRLTGAATLAEGRLEAGSRLAIDRLEPVGDALGTPMAGGVTLEATAKGALDALQAEARLTARDLLVQGRRFGETELTATAAGLPASPQGTFRARTALAGAGLSLDGGYALEGQTLRLSDLAIASGRNRITGALQVALDSLTATGRLDGDLPELQTLSELAGLPLSGGAGFTIALDAATGRQAATLTADANALRVEGDGAPLLAAQRLTARAEVADALGNASGTARLELQGGEAAGNALSRLTAGVDGTLAKASFQAEATGAGQDPMGLQLAGGFSRDGALNRIRLERLQGRYQGESFRMTGPATAVLGDRHYELSGLRIVSGNARLAADLGLRGERLRGELRLDQVPMALARLASPSLRLDGVLNGQATLGGTTRDPRADASLRVANLRAEQTGSSGVPGIDATVDARWRNKRVAVDGDIATRGGAARLALKAGAPLLLDPESLAISVPPTGALEASANGSIDVSLANDLLAASGDRAQGIVRLDVRADGTVGAPRLGGAVSLDGGRYENRASGAVITDIAARLVGDGDVFTIRSFSGRTRNGGQISALGVIRPAAEPERQIDIRLAARNARLVDMDIAQADIGADLTVTGSFLKPLLAGPVHIQRADINIPNSLPTSVVRLDVVEVGGGRSDDAAAARQAAAAAEEEAFALALDMTVEAPNQIFVRGRGLEAEFKAQLAVNGTAAQPSVTGQVTILQGELNLLAQRFQFTRGIIDFDGGAEINPRLDFLSEVTANDVTAQVLVTGTARQPKLELTSPQGLPQDEVLARVLFGKRVGELGAAEAVQLAQSAATLAGFGGGGGGLMEKVRRGLGVERLDFSTADGGSVEAGRYVSDRVYVGVEQGMGANQSRAKVEVDITDNIQAEADVGTDAQTRFGLKFEWDY